MFCEILNSLFHEKELSTNLTEIIKIRNKIAHNSSLNISQQDFADYWTSLLSLSKFFKIDEKVMEDIKNGKSEKSNEKDKIFEKPNDSSKFSLLKEKANIFFTQKNYKTAIEIYTEAMSLDILSNERAVLFSNRSCSYLNLYLSSRDSFDLMRSISDAKQTITLWPYWPKGYIRLGSAYEYKNKMKKALASYEKAINLDPTNKIVDDLISNLKLKFMKKNLESINPNTFPSSFDEEQDKLQNYLKKSTGLSYSQKEMNILIKSQVSDDIYKAFEYLHGSETKEPSLEKATQYFAKAAQKGNAEGMYNLALGLIEGAGINKDPQAGLALLEKAANMPAFDKNNIPVIGVAESQFALGDYYENGIFVKRNIETAIFWYEKASENGFKTAPNNLGVLYYKGMGVKVDYEKAEKYFLLAYSRNEPLAEYNLIQVYICLGDATQTLFWLERALKNNNLIAIKEEKNIRDKIYILRNY